MIRNRMGITKSQCASASIHEKACIGLVRKLPGAPLELRAATPMSAWHKAICAGRSCAAAAALCVLLAACSQPAPPAKASARPDTSTSVDARTLAIVAAIRAAGAQFDSSVEVKPLRDPAVDGLLDRAHKLEAQQQVAPAIEVVNKALAIAPNAPDILQYEAELRILVHDWKNAGELAQRSWDLGPKVGALCARNVQTLIEVNQAQGDAAAAAKYRQQLAGCRVPAPARY